MPEPAYKRCKTCGEEKLAADFYRHAESSDGRGSSCKFCVRAKARAWQDAHPDRVHVSRARHQRKVNERRHALGGGRSLQTTAERLEGHTDRSGECWVWTAGLSNMGYGQTSVDGKQQLAHRASYEHYVGPIPEGMDLDHLCHNEDPECKGGPSCPHRACCNPAHLEPTSHIENCRRGSWPKLTTEQAAQIKRLCLDGWSPRDIAPAFGVGAGAVQAIAAGRTWADVDPDPVPKGIKENKWPYQVQPQPHMKSRIS